MPSLSHAHDEDYINKSLLASLDDDADHDPIQDSAVATSYGSASNSSASTRPASTPHAPTCHADRALADRLVPVAFGSALEKRVVGMHQPHPSGSRGSLHFGDHRRHAIRSGQVMPGREKVTRVQADANLGVITQGG